MPLSKLTRSRLIAVALVAPLALVACGGDDAENAGDASPVSTPEGGQSEVSSADEPADPDDSGATADRQQWITIGADYLDGGDREVDECLSAGVVDGLGYENLADSGTTPEDFWSTSDVTELGIQVDDMDAVADNLVACGDLVDYFAGVSGGTEVQAACLREFFDDEDVAAVIVTSMFGGEPSDELLTKQTDMRACAEAGG